MIENTTWYKQFDGFQPYFFENGVLEIKRENNVTIIISTNTLNDYLNYFYALEWSNVLIHEMTLPMFGNFTRYSDLRVPPHPASETCFLQIQNSTYFNYVNLYSVEECISSLHDMLPGFETSITLRYSENAIYQKYCSLDYCDVTYCPKSQQVTIGFFVATVLTTIYTVLRVFKFVFLWFYFKKYRIQKVEDEKGSIV